MKLPIALFWITLFAQAEDCPYLPEFLSLRLKLAAMNNQEAVSALKTYQVSHENPAACESFEVERLQSEKEKTLLTLVSGSSRLSAQSVYHCQSFDAKTTQCNGVFEDGTAHPFSAGIHSRPIPSGELTGDFRLAGAVPVAAYRARLSNLADGKPAIKLPFRSLKIAPSEIGPGCAIVVIFSSGKSPRFTKAVWYF